MNQVQTTFRPWSGKKSMDGGRGRMGEIEGFDSSKMRNFPFSSFKLLGGMQIGIGGTCLLLGIVDLFLFLYLSEYDDETLSALTIASVPIWCGLWFIVTGAMGSCMSLQQKITLSYFRMTFIVLSVLCALLFAPVMFGIEVYIVVLRSDGAKSAYEWLIPLVIAFFALNEIICAVITAAIGCCCSSLKETKVRVLFTRQVDELSPRPEKRRLDTPEIFYADSRRQSHAPVHHAREIPAIGYVENWDEAEKHMARSPRKEQHQEQEPKPRIALVDDSPSANVTHYSRPPTYDGNKEIDPYRRLRQLSLPGVGTA